MMFWDHASMWTDDPGLAGHTTGRGRVHGITNILYPDCDHYGCKPVVAINPEDREQVERLVGAWFVERYPFAPRGIKSHEVDQMQAALREFARPTPPRPPEPTGLGAVVEDAEGKRWTRVGPGESFDVWSPEHPDRIATSYAAIAAVRVLSEGVG